MALLDELHSMRKDERDIKFWRDHFDAECRQRQLEHWNSRVGNLLDKAGSVASGAASDCATGNCVIGAAKAAKEVATTAFDEYTAYQSFASKMEAEADKTVFEFDTKKLDAMHKRNKEMLQDQWDLIRKYKLNDALRVAESDLLVLIEILKDPRPGAVFGIISVNPQRGDTWPDLRIQDGRSSTLFR